MIITKKVKFKVNPSNLKNLRKYIPTVLPNTIIEIPVEYLSSGSHIKVEVECDICKSIKTIEYRGYVRSIANAGYYTCSQKCSTIKVTSTNLKKYGFSRAAQSPEVIQKIKNTNLEKYGVDNPSKSSEIINKIKNIFIEKYGVENIGQLQSIKDKIMNTNLEKYGVINTFQYELFKDKAKKTNLETYGVEFASQSDVVKNKMKKTNLERYGVEYPIFNEEIKNKMKETNLKKYGVENAFGSEEIKNRIRETNLKKYGVEYTSQDPEIYQKSILSGYRIKKHQSGLNYQGTYEKDFLDYCNLNNIIVFKSPSFKYEMNGKSKRYFPDFFIKDLNLIVEVKSTYYYNLHKYRNELKKQSVLNNEYNYLMILDKNYNEINEKYVK